MRRLLFCMVFMLAMASGLQTRAVAETASSGPIEWKAEFDAVCGQTDNAADLTVAQLKKAIERCDALKPRIESLEATPRKVYLKRLLMCRNLFAYLLEGKEKK